MIPSFVATNGGLTRCGLRLLVEIMNAETVAMQRICVTVTRYGDALR